MLLLKHRIFFVLNTVNEYHFDLVNYKYRILVVEGRLLSSAAQYLKA